MAARALPASAQPVLQASSAVDDSAGDNNQILEPGESAVLVVTISNTGDQDATTVVATLSTSTPKTTVTNGGPKTVDTITANDQAQVTFGIAVDSSYPCVDPLTFDLSLTSDQGPTSVPLTEHLSCPAYDVNVGHVSITDSTTGDSLTGAGLGQTVDLTVRLMNKGTTDVTNIMGHLAGLGVNITKADATYGTIAAGQTAEGTFVVTPSSCPSTDVVELPLHLTTGQGPQDDEVTLPIACDRLPIVIVAGTWDDRTTGNGDGLPQRGEAGLVVFKIRNVGETTLTGVTATLLIDGADVSGGPVSFGDVAAGAEAVSTPALTVHLPGDAAIGVGPPCEATSLINGVDFDSHRSEEFEPETSFVDISGFLRVVSGDKTTEFQTAGTAVCAVHIGVRTPTDEIAATGGVRRFDLLWLALVIVACGVVLRRASLVRL